MFSNLFSLGLFDGITQQPDSHLNTVSIEYPEDEVFTATRNFDAAGVLGSGTFGSVYKGTMRDGTEVAVKLLQVPEEAGFEEEVKVLSRFRHPNLVILMGFSRHASTGARSLIYEYLAGGDASRRLQRSRAKLEPYEWKQRLNTALDSASGLSHLHNANPRAFHRDIKGPNILLDKNGTAKMADFGLSCVSQYAHHKVQQASGTVGYACPEYIRSGIITEGSEVHSFGMVLLELLTGAPPAVQRPDKPKEFCYLVDHLQGSSQKVIEMLDQTGKFPLHLAETLTSIAFDCILPRSANRPSFVQLVGELRRLISELEQPRFSQKQSDALDSTLSGQSPPPARKAHRPAGLYPEPQGPAHELPSVPAGLIPGQLVEARFQGGLSWVQGRILRANPNDTFAIGYDNNDYEDQVPVYHIRQIEPASQAGAGSVGWEYAAKQASMRFLAPGALHPTSESQPVFVYPAPALAHRDGPEHVEERASECEKPLEPSVTQDRRSRLFCIFSEGVSDLGRLDAQQRAIDFPTAADELIVGRTVQPVILWDALIPNPRLRGTVSREHFKVVANRNLVQQQLPTFSLLCLSANGLLVNGTFVRNTDGLRPLQHGDIVAFCVEVEPTDSLDREGAAGSSSRKPFIAFTFELQLVPAANQQTTAAVQSIPAAVPLRPPAGQHSAKTREEGDELPAPKPPKGTTAGEWGSSNASCDALDGMVCCLEVHGEHVRKDLPREARQLFYCHPSSSSSTPPALRVGAHYQRDFWRRVMRFGVASKSLEQDHFEIVSMQRSNPMGEPSKCNCRVRILASRGLMINFSTMFNRGEECELRPNDTLSVVSATAEATDVRLRGLHFTFFPCTDSINKSSQRSQTSEVSEEAFRRLPDFSEADVEANGDGFLVMERTLPSHAHSSVSRLSAGALKPPSAASSGSPMQQRATTPVNAVLLDPLDEGEAGDLFSKTGFGTAADEV